MAAASARLPSHSLALVLLPPPHLAAPVDVVRSANDKSWPRYSAHITILPPFGSLDDLPRVTHIIRETLASPEIRPFRMRLHTVGQFTMRDYETIYLGTSDAQEARSLWRIITRAVAFPTRGRPFVPHMTLGQTARNPVAATLLADKGNLLLERHQFEWMVDSVALLRKREDMAGFMQLHAQIPLGLDDAVPRDHVVFGTSMYRFDGDERWNAPIASTPPSLTPALTSLTVATYNVLHDPAFPFAPRLSAVLSALRECGSPNNGAHVICLQEVTDASLRLIARDDYVRALWPWCSRDPERGVLESERNVVMFARDTACVAHQWTRVPLGGGARWKRKSCAVLLLRLLDPVGGEVRVALAGVHLSAGRDVAALQRKREEMDALLAHLRVHHARDEWVIFGDVNWPDNEAGPFPAGNELLDVWSAAYGCGTEGNTVCVDVDGGNTDGATYDPTSNPLAAATAKFDHTPKRFDRVFVKRYGRLVAESPGLTLFGLPQEGREDVGSDHWGLKVVLKLHEQEPLSVGAEDARPQLGPSPLFSAASEEELIPVPFTDDEIQEVCIEKGYMPTENQTAALQTALDAIRNFVSRLTSNSEKRMATVGDAATSMTSAQTTAVVRLVVEPVGSFAMGYHTSTSDLDCVVVGNVSPQTFWMLLRRRLRTIAAARSADDPVLTLRRFVSDASVPVMELMASGVKVDLQYCAAGRLVECWDDLLNIPRDSPLFSLPVSVLRTLNAHRDVQALLRSLGVSLEAFRLAHRTLRLFFAYRGAFGARFGLLGGFQLAIMLSCVCSAAPEMNTNTNGGETVAAAANAARLVRRFLSVYARWDWERDVVLAPAAASFSRGYHRAAGRERMVVLSVETPHVNTMANASIHSMRVVKRALVAGDRACREGLSWRQICGVMHDAPPPLVRFVKEHENFVKIEVEYWGSSCKKGRALVGWLESRFVSILVALHSSASQVHAHLWPARLTNKMDIDPEKRSLSGFYLIGLHSVSGGSTHPARGVVSDAMSGVLRAFEEEVRSNTRVYDSTETFVSLTSVVSAQLPSDLVFDDFQWPDSGYDEDNGEDDESVGDGQADAEDVAQAEEDFFAFTKQKKHKKTGRKPTPHVPARRLRTSMDVYHRLMWDPAVAKEDYVIGYEDRFKGIKETPLGAWKREVEDEAFIPFHRVVYFRRKSDHVIVWDKRTKVDLVFGSGVVALDK